LRKIQYGAVYGLESVPVYTGTRSERGGFVVLRKRIDSGRKQSERDKERQLNLI